MKKMHLRWQTLYQQVGCAPSPKIAFYDDIIYVLWVSKKGLIRDVGGYNAFISIYEKDKLKIIKPLFQSNSFIIPVGLVATSQGPIAFVRQTTNNRSRLIGLRLNERPKYITEWVEPIMVSAVENTAAVLYQDGDVNKIGLFRFEAANAQPSRFSSVDISHAWNVHLSSDTDRGYWLAYEIFQNRVPSVYVMHISHKGVLGKPIFIRQKGFCTCPSVAPLDKHRAVVVWRKDYPWSSERYAFTENTSLYMAHINKTRVLKYERVPTASGRCQRPTAPMVMTHEGEIRIFYRINREQMRNPVYQELINDWGWQLFELQQNQKGDWSYPFSIDLGVSYADEKLPFVMFPDGTLMVSLHSLDFDSHRETTSGGRLSIRKGNFYILPRREKSWTAPREIIVQQTADTQLKCRQKIQINRETLFCYFGDIHRHSTISKCMPEDDGTIYEHMKYAKGVRNFDFYCLTDHHNQLTLREWEEQLALNDFFNTNNSFVTLHGYEWALLANGHMNFHFIDYKTALWAYHHIKDLIYAKDIFACASQAKLAGRLMAVRHFHADTLPYLQILQDANYLFDPRFEWVTEAVQARGFSPRTIHELLKAGLRFGVVGGSDHNRPQGHPLSGPIGYAYEHAVTGIWAGVLTRKDIFTAFKQRNTFCTNGPRFSLFCQVNGAPMGSVVKNRGHNKIMVTIAPTTTVTEIRLLYNGKLACNLCPKTSTPETFTFEHNAHQNGYYTVEAFQIPDKNHKYPGIGWTSPVWLE